MKEDKKPVRVLLVEDNPADVFLFRLAMEGCPVAVALSVAADGEEASRLLANGHDKPNVIVLDLNLPKLSGLDVLKRFRGDGNDHVPVLIFSSSESPSDINAAFAAGANAYAVKGYEIETYHQAVEGHIQPWIEKIANFIATEPDVESAGA